MAEGNRKHVMEWMIRARHDMEAAQLIHAHQGPPDAASVLIQQAVEKALKGFLVLNGIDPPRIHSLQTLLAQASRFEESLGRYEDLCIRASRYYVVDRYPPLVGPRPDQEQIGRDLTEAAELLGIIERAIAE